MVRDLFQKGEKLYIWRKVLFGIIFGALLLYFLLAFGMKLYAVIACDYPKEFREMNIVVFAWKFAQGENPYALSIMGNEVPEATNLYGFLMPLLLSVFIRIFSGIGISALQISELVTLLVEILGATFFYYVIYMRCKSHILAMWGAILYYSCHWRFSAGGGAFPDQWGMTASMFLMAAIAHDEKKNKRHLLLYAFIVVCLFYIKQYFVFCILGLLVYLWKQSKKDCVKLIVYGAVLGIASIGFVWVMFPLYFAEVIPMTQGSTASGGLSYSLGQIRYLSMEHYAVVSLLALASSVILVIRCHQMSGRWYQRVWNSIRSIQVSYEALQVIFVLVPLIVIARNTGTRNTYYLQLWYPYVIVCGIMVASHIIKYFNSHKKLFWNILLTGAGVILIAYSIYKTKEFTITDIPSREQHQNWLAAYEMLEEYAGDGEILVSPHLASFCLENGIKTSDYGQAEYSDSINLENYLAKPIWQRIFPETGVLLKNNIEYNAKIKEKIEKQEYSCIAVTKKGRYGVSNEYIESCGYFLLTEMELPTGSQMWNTRFYVREV